TAKSDESESQHFRLVLQPSWVRSILPQLFRVTTACCSPMRVIGSMGGFPRPSIGLRGLGIELDGGPMIRGSMSVLGQTRTFAPKNVMSALIDQLVGTSNKPHRHPPFVAVPRRAFLI